MTLATTQPAPASTLTAGRAITRFPLPEAFILLLAALTRLWRPGYHSIWFDEAVSLRWARSDASWIWDQTFPLVQDKHPPGYYLYLHLWNNLFEAIGQDHNDILLRATGALLGVLTVLGILLLVRAVSGRRLALIAAALAAISPALVWYSQELRMFQPAATAAVWSAYFLVTAWRARRGTHRLLLWLGMALALALGVYTYLFSAFLYPAAGLSLLILFVVDNRSRDNSSQNRQRNRRRFIEGLLALALATALFLPLARNAWLVNDAESIPGTLFGGFLPALWRQARVFTIWRPEWPYALETALIALGAFLLLAGLLLPRSRAVHNAESPHARLFIALWLLIPLLIGGVMLATTASVFGEDRYFLFLAPFALWAIARGAIALTEIAHPATRALGWLGASTLAIALFAALFPLWTPTHARENWRAAITEITTSHAALPSLRTAVISHIDYTHLPAEWYLRQQYTFDELPLYFPFGGALTPDQIDTVIAPPLAGVEQAGFDTLWLLQSHLEGMDDARLVETWLAERYPLITEQFPAGIRQTAYAIRSVFEGLPTGVERDIDVQIAPEIRLAACEIITPTLSARDQFLHPPSGRAHVRLWWQADAVPAQNYRAQVRVVNDAGVWGEIIDRPGDTLAIFPTSTWSPDAFVRHEVDVNLNPQTPPGDFTVTVTLLDARGEPTYAPVACGSLTIE